MYEYDLQSFRGTGSVVGCVVLTCTAFPFRFGFWFVETIGRRGDLPNYQKFAFAVANVPYGVGTIPTPVLVKFHEH